MKHTFSFPKLPSLTDRDEVELEPDGYTVMRALHDMREFLMHIEDYDLIKVPGETTKGGVHELREAILQAVPDYYDEANTEKYTRLLEKLEGLTRDWVLHYNSRLKYQYPFNPVFDRYIRERKVHHYAVMLYALAVAALGEHARAMEILDYFLLYRIDPETIPELGWVRSHVLSYERYGYRYQFV